MAMGLDQFVTRNHYQQQPEERTVQIQKQNQGQIDQAGGANRQIPNCPLAPAFTGQRNAPRVYCSIAYWL